MTAVERFRANENREHVLFAVGTLLLVAHVINHTIADGAVDVAPTVITSATVVTALLYRVLPKVVTLGVALFAGVTHTVGGIVHIVEIVRGSPAGGDYTGPLSTPGSLLLLFVASLIVRRWIGLRRPAA